MKSSLVETLNKTQSLLAEIEESLAINTRRTDIQDYLFDFHQGRWSAVYGEDSDDTRCWNCYQSLQGESSPLGLCVNCFESNPCEYADNEHIDDSWEQQEFKYLIDHGKDRTVWAAEFFYQNYTRTFEAAVIVEVVVDGIIYTKNNCGSSYTACMASLKELDEYDAEIADPEDNEEEDE
jgi:hypothetical protein